MVRRSAGVFVCPSGSVRNLISVEEHRFGFAQSAMTSIRSSISTKMSTAMQQLDMVSIPSSASSPPSPVIYVTTYLHSS